MAEFTVHSVPGSPFGRAVLATLIEKGADFDFAALPPGASKSESHLSRHPFGRVPVLEHGDFTLYETQAILRYLDRILAEPALTPADPRDAARMDQVMNINDWYVFQDVGRVIGFQRVIAPKFLGMDPDEAVIEAAMPKAHVAFAVLDSLVADRPFFAGDQVSLADLLVAPQVDFLVGLPEWEPLTEATPNLLAWLDRMNARPSMQATTWERVAGMAQAA
jgi:glutathione S-transferase